MNWKKRKGILYNLVNTINRDLTSYPNVERVAGVYLSYENVQLLGERHRLVESFENCKSFYLGPDIMSCHFHINFVCGECFFFTQLVPCENMKTVLGLTLN